MYYDKIANAWAIFLQAFNPATQTVSALAATIGLFLVVFQMRLAVKHRRRELTLQILDRYREASFKQAEWFIKYQMDQSIVSASSKDKNLCVDLPSGERLHVRSAFRTVSQFFDYIGILARNKTIDVDMLLLDIADDIVVCRIRLDDYIEEKRRERELDRQQLTSFSNLPYLLHFDYIVNLAHSKEPPRRLREMGASLNLMPLLRSKMTTHEIMPSHSVEDLELSLHARIPRSELATDPK